MEAFAADWRSESVFERLYYKPTNSNQVRHTSCTVQFITVLSNSSTDVLNKHDVDIRPVHNGYTIIAIIKQIIMIMYTMQPALCAQYLNFSWFFTGAAKLSKGFHFFHIVYNTLNIYTQCDTHNCTMHVTTMYKAVYRI